MDTLPEPSLVADTTRIPLAQLAVAGTPLERSLERIVTQSEPGRVQVAAFSSSI